MTLQTAPSWGNVVGTFTQIPFVGGAITMIILNLLLFVPYGFLFPIVVRTQKWNWWKAFLLGLCSSLCIEILQMFSGRLCEVDDILANSFGTLAGYLIWRSLTEIRKKERRKEGITRFILAIVVYGVALWGISFVANAESVQEREQAEYPGIYGDEDAMNDIASVRLISSEHEYVGTNLFDDAADFSNAYMWMAMNIDNVIAIYQFEEAEEVATVILNQSSDKYVEVIYQIPHTFRFINKPDWEMADVAYLLYDVNDGSIWYGASAENISGHLMYSDEEHPFQPDTELIDVIEKGTASN